jgi:DNA-binding PucR family transcriptional regulator
MTTQEKVFRNKVENRMELILDDVLSIRKFIDEKMKDFSDADKEEIETYINNIEIASDLTDPESDGWYIVKD